MTNWLKEGEQTKITPKIKEIGKKLQKKSQYDAHLVLNILEWVRKNIRLERKEEIKKKLFRKRTSDKIIRDGYATGCTDLALAFIPIARSCDIPTKYVETVNKKWLKKATKEVSMIKKGQIKGHVVAECKIGNKWYVVDVDSGTVVIKIENTSFNRNFEVVAEGLDSWDLGVKSLQDLKNFFQNKLQDVSGTA